MNHLPLDLTDCANQQNVRTQDDGRDQGERVANSR